MERLRKAFDEAKTSGAEEGMSYEEFDHFLASTMTTQVPHSCSFERLSPARFLADNFTPAFTGISPRYFFSDVGYTDDSGARVTT